MNGLRKPEQGPANRRNSGFTLIELMIVISIIALLIGLLLPAIWGVMRAARDAEVRTEITQLETAITTFQAEYGGIAPPSRITFYSNAAGYNNDPRSKAIIRRIWPQFNFAQNGGGGPSLTGPLNGAECIVFFLGGVQDTNKKLTGFSKNPALPFKLGGNRVGPFFEFDSSRVTDPGTSGNPNAPEYLDPLPSQTSPYIYYSSYDGRGYRTTATPSELLGGMTDVYRLASGSTAPAHKAQTFQIISPGADGEYGTGGVYDPENADSQLVDIDINNDDDCLDPGERCGEAERDNITNFSKVRLAP